MRRILRVLIAELDTVALVAAVILITIGLWPWVHRLALVVPGAVLLYLALPSRDPFLRRNEPASKPARRSD